MALRAWTSAGVAVVLITSGAVVWWRCIGYTAGQDCPPSTSANSTVAPASPGEALLTRRDGSNTENAAAHVRLRVGQRIAVLLDAGEFGGWTSLQLKGTSVQLVSSTGGYDHRCVGGSPLLTHLQARAPGSTTLTSYTDESCRHGEPACGLPTDSWIVTVDVAT